MASNFRYNNGYLHNGCNGNTSGGSGGGPKHETIGRHIFRNGFNQHPFKKQRLAQSPNKNRNYASNGVSSKNQLPILNYRSNVFKLLNENETLLIVGETGSGKTTQIPRWCLDYCKRTSKSLGVVCTQPRRIAAMSVAERVAREMNTTIGKEVGYVVRFEKCLSDETRLRYMTDGMLLREATFNEMLTNYGVIILDEAHERTLQTEILFGIIKRALKARNSCDDGSLPPLKVVIMSATINVKLFKKYFNSPVLHIEGRQHPVQELFAENPQSDLLTATLTCVFQVHRTQENGDILVFCSGQDEIRSLVILTKNILKQAPTDLQNLIPLPLYATLPAASQMRVFNHKQSIAVSNGQSSSNEALKKPRRVIYSTNVAETSVTIPNIKYVIDTGKVKCRSYCPKTGMESLKVTTISRAQAKQRSGRAGRVAPGICYHLYTNEDYFNMSEHLPPEIKRCSLDGVLLQIIGAGISNIDKFDFLEKPEDARIRTALTNLLNLRAIEVKPTITVNDNQKSCHSTEKSEDSNHDSPAHKKKSLTLQNPEQEDIIHLNYDLTQLGLKLRVFPLDPSMSRVILAANELGCLDEALTIVSLLSIESLFHIPPNKQAQAESVLTKFHSNEGDLLMLLKVFKAFKRARALNNSGLRKWCSDHFINTKNLKMAVKIRKQLQMLATTNCLKPSTCGQDTSIIRRALTYGLFNNVATMWDGKYRNKTCNDIHIHPSSCLFRTRPECVLYVEIVETNKCYMRNCTLIDMNWVREVSASAFKISSPRKS